MATYSMSAKGERIWYATSTDRRTHIVADDGSEKKYSLCRLVIDPANETPAATNVCRSCREEAVDRLQMWHGTVEEWDDFQARRSQR